MPSTNLTFPDRNAHRAWLATQAALPAGFRVGCTRFDFMPREAPKPAKMTLTLIALEKPTADFAAAFTRNAFPGAPVIVGRKRLREPTLGAILVNNQVFDRVNTTAAVWLGTTLECAQCHDHKYDPFTQKEYYRLFAYFNSTAVEADRANPNVPGSIRFLGPYLTLPDRGPNPERDRLAAELRRLDGELAARRKALTAGLDEWADDAAASLGKAGQVHVLEVADYGTMSVIEAIRVSRRHGLHHAPVVALIFPVLHASHGIGFGVGLVHYALSPDWDETPPPPRDAFATPAAIPERLRRVMN